MSATKFESFCVDPSEQWIFAGNASGQILVIHVDGFDVRGDVQAHAGIVQAIACHRREPYVAALSTDRHVTVWRYQDRAPYLELVCDLSLRAVRPENDVSDVEFVHSTSQAIGFHDEELRIVTRSANGGVLEFGFTPDGTIRILGCWRLHGRADLISVRYARHSDDILSGSVDGQLALSRKGIVCRTWELGDSVVHWAEPLGDDDSYLLASDMRYVARIRLESDDLLIGPQFTRDDLEHVTVNPRSGRAFVGSFDRNVYEVDPDTCAPMRVAFQAPFKCRWVKTLEREPATGVVQCRDGALYKVDVDTGTVLASLKLTPPALWTSVVDGDGALVLAGEGGELVRLLDAGVDSTTRVPRYSKTTTNLGLPDCSYTKRAALGPDGRLYLGRTSGRIYEVEGTEARLVSVLPAAVRDLAVDRTGTYLFAACEDGTARMIDGSSGESVSVFESKSQQPIWSLAYNAARESLAVAERRGGISILDTGTFQERIRGLEAGRPKRMKWVDDDVLLYNFCDELRSFDIASGLRQVRVRSVGNTIEDFIWDGERRYIVCVSYTQNIYLCDFECGDVISCVPDQMDYSKGLSWVPRTSSADYALDFVTYGRSGTAQYFRVHDEKILAMGPV